MIHCAPHLLLKLFNRLISILESLPGGLRGRVLSELKPIREVFLEQRTPRLLLVGSSGMSAHSILAAFGAHHIQHEEHSHGWKFLRGRATDAGIFILDARDSPLDANVILETASSPADLILNLHDEEMSTVDKEIAPMWVGGMNLPVITITPSATCAHQISSGRKDSSNPSTSIAAVGSLDDPLLPETICAALPAQARLEFARLTNARRAQLYIAKSLLKSFSTVCGMIGLQPIPVADLPILATMQSLMVGMIIHTAGRCISPKLMGEFIAALGLSFGAGFVCREAARAALRVVPIWGNGLSGIVAGAGTYAIGCAAIAYFISESHLEESQKMYGSRIPRKKSPTKF